MVTAIVRKVQAMLQASGRQDVAVEIVFPVASEAITTDNSARSSPAQDGNGTGNGVTLPGGLPVVPGPAGGEGCSAEGGCASCPYMKVTCGLFADYVQGHSYHSLCVVICVTEGHENSQQSFWQLCSRTFRSYSCRMLGVLEGPSQRCLCAAMH